MTWLLTSTGREHDLSQTIASIENTPTLREISHSLSQINRYTGHSSRPYSVAEHSLLVFDIAFGLDASTIVCLAALMHDAHESITGDVSSPVKHLLGDTWKSFEDKHQDALLSIYNIRDVSREFYELINLCDLIALATERRDLLAYSIERNRAWPSIDVNGHKIVPWPKVNLNDATRWKAEPAYWANMFETKSKELLEAVGILSITV